MSFMLKDTAFTLAEAETILGDAEKFKDFILHEPPLEPKGGDVYLYKSLQEGRSSMDFRFDQMVWKQKGSNLHNIKKYGGKVLKRYYHIRTPKHNNGSAAFKKHVYALMDPDNLAANLYLVHYLGDETVHVPMKHGNAKMERVFIPSKKQVFANIHQKHHGQFPSKTYQSTLAEASSENVQHMPVNCPRNLKQVQNTVYANRNTQRICRDELFGLHELAYQLPGFVWHISSFPDLLVFVGMPEMLDLARANLEEAVSHSYPQLISYDTTFEMGDFYLSVVVMRNTALTNDPVFPVGFMLHERKFMQHHEMFLKDILGKLGMGSKKLSKVPLVVDREKGIVGALKKAFPNVSLVYCRNHVLRDIKYWVQKHGGTRDDVKVLTDQIDMLIDSASKEQFEAQIAKFRLGWSEGFVNYFDQHLHLDLCENLASFYTRQFEAFKKKSPSNNISEAMNKMIKTQTDWRELPVDCMVLSLYYMQSYFLFEFQRARLGLGNYSMKQGVPLAPKDVKMPSFIPLESIIDRVRSEITQEPSKMDMPSANRLTQSSLAKTVVEMGLVSLDSSAGVFVVKSPSNESVHAVHNTSNGTKCSCPSSGKCFHVLAVEMVSGLSLDSKRTYSLSTMRKRGRGKETKSGRKKPRTKDFDYSVNPAPDSILSNLQSKIPRSLKKEDETHDYSQQGYTAGAESTAAVQGIATFAPWIDADLNEPNWSTVAPRSQCLAPKTWLEGETIEQAITSYINECKVSDSVLCMPTFMYQMAAVSRFGPVLQLCAAQKALNFDTIFIPFNTDVKGPGSHWLLAAVEFKDKNVSVFNSIHNFTVTENASATLLKVVACIYTAAGEDFQAADWTITDITNAPQQRNGYDCGVFAIVYACAAVNNACLGPVDSHKARLWVHSLVEKYEEVNHGTSCLSQKKLLCYREKMQTYDTEVSALCVRVRGYSISSTDSETVCYSSTCQDDGAYNDEYTLCVLCRRWFHLNCAKPVDRLAIASTDYYKCLLCSS